MKKSPLTVTELKEILAKARLASEDTPQRVARDIKRLHRMREIQSKERLHRETVKVLDSAEHNIDERLVRIKYDYDKLADMVQELERPYRTDNQKHFAKAHDALCRENKGELPSYQAVWEKMRKIFSSDSVPDKRTLRRMNETALHLPMSDKKGRPKKGDKKQRA